MRWKILIGKLIIVLLLIVYLKFGKKILHQIKNKTIYKLDRFNPRDNTINNQYYGILCILVICLFSIKMIVLIPIFYIHTLRKIKRNFYKVQSELKYEFPIWLRNIQMLLVNNTVVVSLSMSSQTAPKLLRSDLDELIEKLKSNPWDMKAFDEFLADYDMIEIRKSMRTLQRLHRGSISNVDDQLETMYTRSVEWIEIERKQFFKKKRDIKSWIAIMPMFNVTVLFVVEMFLIIVSVIEGGWQ